MIGHDPDYDYLHDPQQAPVRGFCRSCGREIYADGKDLCERCEEDGE
jgi:predicted amidophosphoribosyltransferase